MQDILIDLRNKKYLFDDNKNMFYTKSTPQKFLNKTKEVLTYPVIDRLGKSLLVRIEKKRKDILFKKHHSTTYDNIVSEYDFMLSSFFDVATHYYFFFYVDILLTTLH